VVTDAVHACIGNSFRFQGRLHHGMHEAIVQWRIVVVFKQQKNLWLPPVAPGLLSIIVAVLCGQQPPRFIFLFPGARTIQSPAGGCVCEITQVASVAAATWYKPTIQLRSALQIQSRVAFSATATCGISFPLTTTRIISWRLYSTRTGRVGSSRLSTQS